MTTGCVQFSIYRTEKYKQQPSFPQKARFRFGRSQLAHNLYVNFFFSLSFSLLLPFFPLFRVEAKNAVSPIKSMLSKCFYFNFEILVLDRPFQ